MICFRRVDIGLDHPARFDLGFLRLESALLELLAGGPNTVALAQTEETLAGGDKAPEAGPAHVVQPRAGGLAYFGPGVLLVAPVALAEPRMLHQALLDAAAATCSEYGVSPQRRPAHPGLWLEDGAGWRKLASIGLNGDGGYLVARGAGLALNVDPDLHAFDNFEACGIPGVVMTSLAAETGRPLTVAEVADVMAGHLERLLPGVLLEPAGV